MEQAKMQQQMGMGRFDSYGQTMQTLQESTAAHQMEVPASNDVVYDPDHPLADWSGFVSKAGTRKMHSQPHARMSELEYVDEALTTTEHAAVVRAAPRRTLGCPHDTASSELIGGVDIDQAQRFKTTYMSQVSQDSTRMDQLTFRRQSELKGAERTLLAIPGTHIPNSSRQVGSAVEQSPHCTPSSACRLRGGPEAPMLTGLTKDIATAVYSGRDEQPSEPIPRAAAPWSKEMYDRSSLDRIPGYTGKRSLR